MSAEVTRLRDIVRGKDPMHGLCKERLITPEACDWVKTALDPFHDMQIENLRGYPDVATEPTVVIKIRQAVSVSKPVGLADGENWDCHIVLSPIDYSPGCADQGNAASPQPCAAYPNGSGCHMGTGADHQAGSLVNSKYGAGTPPVARMDGLVINSVPSSDQDGANMTYTPGHMPRDSTGGYQCQGVHLDDYLDFEETDLGVYRVIYSGFEVVNTTAQIAKQGAVTVYEYGNSYEVAASVPRTMNTAGAVVNPIGMCNPTTYFRMPPNTLAEAKIMPGAHSWAAQDGCYNTAKFQTDNPFQSLTKRNWVMCQNDASRNNSASGYIQAEDPFSTDNSLRCGSLASDRGLTEFTANDPPTTSLQSGSTHFSRMNTTGAYFTGLSSSTTLFVTWRVGLERLPAANKPTFLALAQPSATFDPNALVLYNMVANILPPGCPQGYNDAGTWFRWISEAAKKSIPAVYPVVRTASMLATAMGRPVLAKTLGVAGAMMKPAAEDIAARRLQGAMARHVAKKKKKPQTGGGKMAVGNWKKPSMRGTRNGGRNGLG